MFFYKTCKLATNMTLYAYGKCIRNNFPSTVEIDIFILLKQEMAQLNNYRRFNNVPKKRYTLLLVNISLGFPRGHLSGELSM